MPIEALIASLCRALGLPPRGTPPAGGPAAGGPTPAAKAGADESGPKGRNSGPASHRASSNVRRTMPAEEFGRPEGERRIHTTGEIFNQDRELAPALPGDDRPLAGTGPPGDTGPPAVVPPPAAALPHNRHG